MAIPNGIFLNVKYPRSSVDRGVLFSPGRVALAIFSIGADKSLNVWYPSSSTDRGSLLSRGIDELAISVLSFSTSLVVKYPSSPGPDRGADEITLLGTVIFLYTLTFY